MRRMDATYERIVETPCMASLRFKMFVRINNAYMRRMNATNERNVETPCMASLRFKMFV